MKRNLFLLIFSLAISCKSQIYPLRTYSQIPENAYLKDTNNELLSYAGTWKGTWNNKTIYITFSKITNQYDDVLKYYKDNLTAKFKILDTDGTVLFDNTSSDDLNAKIWGGKFRKLDDKYSLIYIDPELCNTSGNVIINFVGDDKNQLHWKFNQSSNMITSDCRFYSTGIPEVLPKEIVLARQ